MTRIEFKNALITTTSGIGVVIGFLGEAVRISQLGGGEDLSLVARDPLVWLSAVAIGLGFYLSSRTGNINTMPLKEIDNINPPRHVVEKHNFEVTPLGINIGDDANLGVSSEKLKVGTVKEDDRPDLMDTVINMAAFDTTVPIIRFSKRKKE